MTRKRRMSLEEILKVALKLKQQDRLTVVDGLLRSLEQPAPTLTRSGWKRPSRGS